METIAIISQMWKRHEVFQFWKKSMLRVKEEYSDRYNIEIIVAGSEGEISRGLCSYIHYVECHNMPLGNKFNQSAKKAKELGADWVFSTGSDDVIGLKFLDAYMMWAESPITPIHIGMRDFYQLERSMGKFTYWPGYEGMRKDESAGAFRFFSSGLMEMMNWEPWNPHLMRGVDGPLYYRINQLRVQKRILNMSRLGTIGIATKGTTNITPYNALKNIQPANIQLIKKHFPKEEADILLNKVAWT